MNEQDRKEILGVMKEISNSKTRARGESDFQREAIKNASEKYSIDKKTLRKMANTYHKGTFVTQVQAEEDFQVMYANVTGEQVPE